ncbi:MAG: S8 family serine peptidase [Saprospiraceae bacterium]|nr:S8 family serine peptidase [Saprospiraceae bacterium]
MRFIVILAFSCFYSSLFSQSYSKKITEKLLEAKKCDVLIELKSKADLSFVGNNLTKKEKAEMVYSLLRNNAEMSQVRLVNYLQVNNINFQSFIIVNAIHATIDQKALNDLLSFQEIKFIYYDETLKLLPVTDNTFNTLQARGPMLTWGIERIEADKVWSQGYEGQGVTIAGEDTGYNWEVEGIKNKYRGYNTTNQTVDHNYNWHDAIHKASPLSADSINPCGYSIRTPCDDHGHGTHTVGTMTGSTEKEIYGVAPKANWIGCRNMERGNGALSTYIECFEFFLAPTDLDGLNPKPSLAPSAINNSWYCSREEGCDESNFAIMEEVVNNLRTSGIVVVVSAGNSGQVCGNISAPPAIFKSSFTVGSFAINDTISSFSSSGPVYNYKDTIIKPDVCAPGSDVLSRTHTGELAAWSGTSMAGPHVAGLVALIINANPELDGNVSKIEEIIKLSSRPADANIDCIGSTLSARPNHVYGYGKILAPEAIRLAIITKTSNSKQSINKFIIQPNPVVNSLRIINLNNDSYTYSLRQISGKVIFNQLKSSQTLDMSSLNSGVYILQCNQTGQNEKFVKF